MPETQTQVPRITNPTGFWTGGYESVHKAVEQRKSIRVPSYVLTRLCKAMEQEGLSAGPFVIRRQNGSAEMKMVRRGEFITVSLPCKT